MLNYDGEMVSNERGLNLTMECENEARDIFDISDVSVERYESCVDAAVPSVFVAYESFVSDSGHVNDDDGFAQALSLRGEISKFGANIDSCTISDDSCSLFTPDIDSIHDSITNLLHHDTICEMQSAISSL